MSEDDPRIVRLQNPFTDDEKWWRTRRFISQPTDGPIEFDYFRSRYSDLGEMDEEEWGIQMRWIVGRLRVNGVAVGHMKLREWRIAENVSDKWFFEALDTDSGECCELAEAFLSGWSVASIAGRFTILHFDRLWIAAPFARNSTWAKLAENLIARSRNAAVLLLLPLPLEYIGCKDDGRERIRRAALYRLYAQKLGVTPLDASWTSRHPTGMMYRIVKDRLGMPKHMRQGNQRRS
jgi:hypothetical protein